jgi:hypothetical protein
VKLAIYLGFMALYAISAIATIAKQDKDIETTPSLKGAGGVIRVLSVVATLTLALGVTALAWWL